MAQIVGKEVPTASPVGMLLCAIPKTYLMKWLDVTVQVMGSSSQVFYIQTGTPDFTQSIG